MTPLPPPGALSRIEAAAVESRLLKLMAIRFEHWEGTTFPATLALLALAGNSYWRRPPEERVHDLLELAAGLLVEAARPRMRKDFARLHRTGRTKNAKLYHAVRRAQRLLTRCLRGYVARAGGKA